MGFVDWWKRLNKKAEQYSVPAIVKRAYQTPQVQQNPTVQRVQNYAQNVVKPAVQQYKQLPLKRKISSGAYGAYRGLSDMATGLYDIAQLNPIAKIGSNQSQRTQARNLLVGVARSPLNKYSWQPRNQGERLGAGIGEAGSYLIPFAGVEKGVITGASKLIPKLASKTLPAAAARFGVRRGADILSGQLLTPSDKLVGDSRLKQAAADVALGTVGEGLFRGAGKIKNLATDKLQTNKVANLMDAPIPSKNVTTTDAYGIQRTSNTPIQTKTVEVSIKDFEQLRKTGSLPKSGEVAPSSYKYKGNVSVQIDPETGKLVTWRTDNPNYAKYVQENKLKAGFSTRDVKPSEVNTSKFKISEQAKTRLDETVNAIKPELEAVKGGTLKNADVVDAAKASKILSREVNPEMTKKATAAVTRLRQEVASAAEGKGVSKDLIENLKVLRSYSADAGRKLQAFNIQASPESSIKENIIADLVNLGKKSDDIIAAAKGVDFDNPKQVTDFYRQFVKPTLGEVVNEYRYINLLSSPQTHIVNAFSNLLQGTVLNPATKLYSGAIDKVASTLTGKARTSYIREVPAYTKGFINSIQDATKQAAEVIKGNKFVERPDINRLPTGKLGPGEYITRTLEAGDVFFRTMIKGGELEALAYKTSKSGKKVVQSVLEKEADAKAAYFVFRKALDPSNKTGQGAVLSAIDKTTEAVYKLRKVPGVSWIVPFVQTPMNILKQGIEYSPLGLSTLAGNTAKTEQIAKTLVGSTVLAGAATLESTWAAPTSKNEKSEFYASGRQPYSVKIGDNWVSYSKLGPLAYPIAMAAAVKHYFSENPSASSKDVIEKTTEALGGVAGFFADQSYLSGLGDLLDIARGEEYAINNTIANFGRQLVPLTALQGWVARQLDPIYRESKTIGEKITSGIPFLSKNIKAYEDPLGNESVRQNNTFNSFSPIKVTPVNQQFEDVYQTTLNEKKAKYELQALKEGANEGTVNQLSDGRFATIENGEVKTFDNQGELNVYQFEKQNGDYSTVGAQYQLDYQRAKRANDIESYVKYSQDYLNYLYTYKETIDPNDKKEQIKVQNKIDDTEYYLNKYMGYGGFKKGSSGRRSGGSSKKAKQIKLNMSPLTNLSLPSVNISAPKAGTKPLVSLPIKKGGTNVKFTKLSTTSGGKARKKTLRRGKTKSIQQMVG